jgi:4-amino-4-deoxy-L-arabinose transferase-like glycosyltransferase
MKRRTFTFLALAILLGAAFLRIADLHRFPPGLHYDEAADMLLSRDIAWYGYRPFPVVTAYSGREALFYYVAAPLLRIFGTNVMAARLTSAFLGILTVAATIALGNALFRRRPLALMAGAWLAVSGPQVWLTRQGFRTSPQPLLEALGLWLLWVALRRVRRWMLPAILAGIFCGLALYVYMAARVFPLWLALPLLLLVVVDRAARGRRIRQMLVFFAVLGLTAAPIALFYAAHLDVFTDRLSQLAPTAGTPTLPDSLWLHLAMFFLRGDPLLRYNLDVGRPFFDPVSGILLLIGLGVAAFGVLRGRTPLEKTGAAFVLLCPLLIAPSVIAVQGLPPSHMRSVAMVPLVFFLPMLGAAFVGWTIRTRPRLAFGLAAALLAALGGLTWRDYQAWGGRADLFYDSDGDLNLAAGWLEKNAPPNALFYIASRYYEHPTVLAHNLDPQRIRWMMQDHLILPPPDREAIYIFPRSVDASPWIGLLQAGAVKDVPSGPDGQPAYRVFQFAPGQLHAPTPQIALAANVNNVLRLRGADLPSAAAGQTAQVRLYWEVLNAPGRDDLTPVVSVTDAWNNEIARAMPYFEHTGQWLPGEWIIQNVALKIPPGNPPGAYSVRVAWVGKSRQNDYLPLLDDRGRFAGLWAEAEPLTVKAEPSSTLSVPESASEIVPGLYVQTSALPPSAVKQGEHLRFEVNWFVQQAVRGAKRLKLVADGKTQAVLWAGNPVHNTYPINAWQPGQQVLDRYDVPIPAGFAPGDYRIALILDGASSPVFSQPLQVIAVTRQFNIPALAHRVYWRFGDSIALVGYEVTKGSGQHVTVTLAWQARAIPDRDYTVFVHLTNLDGAIFSQQDSPPSRATSQWVTGEVVTDTYTLAAPPGGFTISVGMYLQDNGLRLPINDASGTAVGDEARLVFGP